MKKLKAGAADLRVSERASGAGLQLGITHQGTQHPGGQSSSAQSKKQFGSEVLEVFFFFLMSSWMMRREFFYFSAVSKSSLAASAPVSLNMTASVCTTRVLRLHRVGEGREWKTS